MFRGTPEQSLWLVTQRQAELIREAEQYRLATPIRGDRADNLSTPRFTSIRTSLAPLFALVRRARSGREQLCDDPVPDCSPC
jgi:hypothetical protein